MSTIYNNSIHACMHAAGRQQANVPADRSCKRLFNNDQQLCSMHTHTHTHTQPYTHTIHLFFFSLHTYSSGLDPRVPEILSPVWKNLWNKIVEELRVRNVRNSQSRLLRLPLLSRGNRRGEIACQGRPPCARPLKEIGSVPGP